MTAQEFDRLVPEGIPYKIRYALVASQAYELMVSDEWRTDKNPYLPYWIQSALESKTKADERMAHQYDPAPRNKPIAQLLKDYCTKGKKIKARAELKRRVPYAAFAEQKPVLCAFLDNVEADRTFALKLLDEQWDEFYAPFVQRAWEYFGGREAAKVIVHHFPTAYIVAHQEVLAAAFNYLQVRLRLPTEAPIDRSRLSGSSYLYLCARLSIPVPDEEAEPIFYQNMLTSIGGFYIESPWNIRPLEKSPWREHSLCDAPMVSSMVWSLGRLGKTDILLRFMAFEKTVYPLVCEQQWEKVKAAFRRQFAAVENLSDKEPDFTAFDGAIAERARRDAMEARLFQNEPLETLLNPEIFTVETDNESGAPF